MATSKTLELSIKIAGRMDKSLTAAINGTQSRIGSLTKSISNIGTVGLATMGAVATAAAVGIAGCTKEAQALESAMAPVVRYVDGLADANDSHWSFTDKVVSNLVELVKYLMAEYGIDAAHVIRHYDVNGKPCPGIIGWNEDTGSAAKWAAFKARLGAATPGGQTGGSTNTGTATGNIALTYKVGDIVQFAGGKHYANAQAASGTTVKPGPAKVTAVATAGKHPYHLVHTDGTSTVYGWVDAAAISGKASATPAVKTYTVKAGDSLWRIAAQQLGNGARYKEIKTLNGLKNDTIHAGQILKLPN